MSGAAVTLTLASAVEAGETVTVGYTVPAGTGASPLQGVAGRLAAAFSDRAVTNDTNTAPTGLPAISGTAEVGGTLTADSGGIADADGLANATYAWQWVANDGTSDADIAGATSETYTLTSAEEGKTIKVRATFTDDGGTEETLVSEATAAVTAALPSVSVAAGSAEATLSVATVDDTVAGADARVSITVTAGAGYPAWRRTVLGRWREISCPGRGVAIVLTRYLREPAQRK